MSEQHIIDYEESLDASKLSRHDKIKFACECCGKEYITYSFNFTHPVCPRCKKSATAKTIDWSLRNKKSAQTKMRKYGDPTFVNPKKCSATKKERYGDSHYNNSEKNKLTCRTKYGVDYIFQANDIKENIKKTCALKYGGIGTASNSISQKIKNTNKERYGYEYGFQSKDVKDKIKATCLQRYGVTNGGASREAKQKIHRKYMYNSINFDSSWEVALYIYLQDKDIEFEYQPNTYFTYYYNGKEHRYYPDFKIRDKYVEIKGNHFFENNTMINPFNRSEDGLYTEKYKCMLSNNVKILTLDKISKYLTYVNQTYGCDYIETFKRNIIK